MCVGESQKPEAAEQEVIATNSTYDAKWDRYGIWIQGFTAFILLITMFAVFWYAFEARRANHLTSKALKQSEANFVATQRAAIYLGLPDGSIATI
jgi:low temperature requirement protein LtrA